MLPEHADQELEENADEDEGLQDGIDLNELAQKIVDLLRTEISIESERTGR
jgi:hypothetical protein